MIVAAIDLGTNTFHILIVRGNKDGSFKTIFRQRDYVYLGKEGVETLADSSYQKGIEVLREYKTFLKKYQVEDYKIYGTEALRLASNGPSFVQEVQAQHQLDINIIDGLVEANLIHKGVRSYLPNLKGEYLIMDIGGGSIEFVHFDEEGIKFAKSFPIGISVLHQKFQKNDPLLKDEISAIAEYVKAHIQSLIDHLQSAEVKALIGSAGSFEIVHAILEKKDATFKNQFKVRDFKKMFASVIHRTFEERKSIPGLPLERVKLMPVAIVLLRIVLKTLEIEDVIVSPFAMKEGIIKELLD